MCFVSWPVVYPNETMLTAWLLRSGVILVDISERSPLQVEWREHAATSALCE